MLTKNAIQIMIISSTFLFFGCSKLTDATVAALAEDSSASGAAASSVGGAIASSSSGGTVSLNESNGSIWNLVQPTAQAANICPNMMTASGAGCNQVSTNVVDLVYSTCSFGSSVATWSGLQEITLVPAAAVTCQSFPAPASGTYIRRQFVSTPGTAGTGSRTTANGTVVVIDHASSNLSNFDTQTIAGFSGGGYGTTVTFGASGIRTGVGVKQRVYVTGGFDHSVDGAVTISESGTTRTVSGTTKVYHNKIKVVGTSTFNSVTYNNTSCVPISGSISTSFAAGTIITTPTTLGSTFVGKTETITFNADGTALLVDPTGASSTVKLSHCY